MSQKARAAEIKAGAVVVVALTIVVVGSLWIAGSSFFGTRHVPYRVLIQDSGGLAPGDRVRVAGVPVGRVQQVELRPEMTPPVVLHVSIRRSVSIGTDSSARISTKGLLGASFLEVDAGSTSAPRLAENGEIVGLTRAGLEEALASIDEISRKVIRLLDKTTEVLDTLSGQIGPILQNLEVLVSEGNADDVRSILSRLREVAETAGPSIVSTLDRLERVSVQLEGGAGELPELMQEVGALIEDVQQALGPDGERLAEVLDSADRSLAGASEAMAAFSGNRGEIEAMLRDLRDTAANLKSFSQQIKEKPFSLIRVKPEADRRPGEGANE